VEALERSNRTYDGSLVHGAGEKDYSDRQPEDNTRESRSTYIVAQYTSIEYIHCTYAYTDMFWVD
jgi:hypothetical protein